MTGEPAPPQQHQQRLETQIAGYENLKAKLERAATEFEGEKLAFDAQKVDMSHIEYN